MVRIRLDYWSLCKNNEIRIHIKWENTCVLVYCFGTKESRGKYKHTYMSTFLACWAMCTLCSEWKISPVLIIIIITIMVVMTFPSEKPQGNTCGSIHLCIHASCCFHFQQMFTPYDCAYRSPSHECFINAYGPVFPLWNPKTFGEKDDIMDELNLNDDYVTGGRRVVYVCAYSSD